MYKERKYIQVFLIIIMITGGYAEDMKEIKMTKFCFNSPYIFLFDTNNTIINEIENITIELGTHENYFPATMTYTIKDGDRYNVYDLFCLFDVTKTLYSCSVEGDGGSLELNVTNNTLSMLGIRTYEPTPIFPPWIIPKAIKRKNPKKYESEHGFLTIGYLKLDKSYNYLDLQENSLIFIKGKDCTRVSYPSVQTDSLTKK